LAIEDITDRKRVEHAMVSSELRYRRLFEQHQDGILILNAQSGEITDANPFLLIGGYFPRRSFGEDNSGKSVSSNIQRQVAKPFKYYQVKRVLCVTEDLPLETKDGPSDRSRNL